MARAKDSEKIKIQLLFPKEFSQLREKLEIKENRIEIRDSVDIDNEIKFQLYPECDIPYKLYALYLSKYGMYKNMSEFDNDSFIKEYTSRHKGSSSWKQYLFQLPNLEKFFGIHKKLKIYNVDKVLQTPIFFLILADVLFSRRNSTSKISLELYKEMYEYAQIALTAYDNGKKSIGFTEEQLVNCSNFFFEKDIFDQNTKSEDQWIKRQNLGNWGDDGKEIESIVHEKVINYIKGIPEATMPNKRDVGAPFSFPKYLRSIIAGIKHNLKFFPFSALDERPLEKAGNTLWSQKSVCQFEGIDPDISEAFTNCFFYFIVKVV